MHGTLFAIVERAPAPRVVDITMHVHCERRLWLLAAALHIIMSAAGATGMGEDHPARGLKLSDEAAGTSTSSAAIAPEQLHLSYHRQPGSMWMTWLRPGVSVAAAGSPFCSYSYSGGDAHTATAGTETYSDNKSGCRSDKAYGGPCVPWSGVIHSAVLAGLPPRTRVRYSCGTTGQMSAPRNFTTPPPLADDSGPVSFALMGDVGTSMRNINGGMAQRDPGLTFQPYSTTCELCFGLCAAVGGGVRRVRNAQVSSGWSSY